VLWQGAAGAGDRQLRHQRVERRRLRGVAGEHAEQDQRRRQGEHHEHHRPAARRRRGPPGGGVGGGDHRQDLPERQALAAAVGTARAARPGEPAAGGPAGLLPVQLGAAAELVVAELVAVRVPGEPPPPGAQPGPAALGAVARERRRRGGVLLVLVQEGRGGDGGRAGAGGGARRGRRRCVALACRVGAPPPISWFLFTGIPDSFFSHVISSHRFCV